MSAPKQGRGRLREAEDAAAHCVPDDVPGEVLDDAALSRASQNCPMQRTPARPQATKAVKASRRHRLETSQDSMLVEWSLLPCCPVLDPCSCRQGCHEAGSPTNQQPCRHLNVRFAMPFLTVPEARLPPLPLPQSAVYNRQTSQTTAARHGLREAPHCSPAAC